MSIPVGNVSDALMNSSSASSFTNSSNVDQLGKRQLRNEDIYVSYILYFFLSLIIILMFIMLRCALSVGDINIKQFRLSIECGIHTLGICGLLFGVSKFIPVSEATYDFITNLILYIYAFLLIGLILNYLLSDNFKEQMWISFAFINSFVYGILITLFCANKLRDKQKWSKWIKHRVLVELHLVAAIVMIYAGLFVIFQCLQFSLFERIRQANNFQKLVTKSSRNESVQSVTQLAQDQSITSVVIYKPI